MIKATGIVLTGGQSRRFGSDKATLLWGGKTFVERRVDQYAPLFDEVLIVGSAPGRFSIPGVGEIEDIFSEAGPLGGIHAGLFHAAHERVFVTGCDMPFFDEALALRLLDLARESDAAVPGERITGTKEMTLQPLFAVYCRSALPEIEKMLRQERRSIRGLYGRVRTKYLICGENERASSGENVFSFTSPSRNPFFNVNFPEDYRRLPRVD
jgi:molybdopterin-guanine dinucleotide biosynthesis protein A